MYIYNVIYVLQREVFITDSEKCSLLFNGFANTAIVIKLPYFPDYKSL